MPIQRQKSLIKHKIDWILKMKMGSLYDNGFVSKIISVFYDRLIGAVLSGDLYNHKQYRSSSIIIDQIQRNPVN